MIFWIAFLGNIQPWIAEVPALRRSKGIDLEEPKIKGLGPGRYPLRQSMHCK